MTPSEADIEPALFLVNHSAINVRGMHLTWMLIDIIKL
jgi:hypothetical protein